MKLKRNVRAPGGRRLLVQLFLWEGDRDVALTEARRGSCALDLWFRLGQARENCRQEFAAWLEDMHAKHGARFGRSAA